MARDSGPSSIFIVLAIAIAIGNLGKCMESSDDRAARVATEQREASEKVEQKKAADAEQEKAAAAEKAKCDADPQCKAGIAAYAVERWCKELIEQKLQFKHEWQTRWPESIFGGHIVKDAASEHYIHAGWKLLAQNQYGAMQKMAYSCETKGSEHKIISVGVAPAPP